MRIELAREILMPRDSNLLGNSTIGFRMCLYLVTYFLYGSHGFVAVPVKSSTISSPLTNYKAINWNKVFVLINTINDTYFIRTLNSLKQH